MSQVKKQNVTLSLNVETIQKAKQLAAQRSTSLSALVATQLESLVGAGQEYERARRSAMERLRKGYDLGGGNLASRDELHER